MLVSRFGEPIICDFGISRIISASQSFGETSGHRVKGSVRWMARELLADPQSVHSKESDVWAFGMTIYVRAADELLRFLINDHTSLVGTPRRSNSISRYKARCTSHVYYIARLHSGAPEGIYGLACLLAKTLEHLLRLVEPLPSAA